jgi:hypothetical protein
MPATATFTDVDANAFSDKVLRWDLMANRLAPLLAERPYLKPLYEEFVQRLKEVKALEFKLQSLKAAAQLVVEERREKVKEGEEIRTRLASALAFEHGPKSIHLREFGVHPRSGGRPRKKPAPAVEVREGE